MGSEAAAQGLKVVDGYEFDDELRAIFKPGVMMQDAQGRGHRLPRYFYEVPSHEAAVATRLTPQFGLNEFVLTDLKEAERLQGWPRYVPCAVRILAFYLQQFREKCGASVHITVNGGYRSPSHKLALSGSPHLWGTAADIYKIGTTILRTEEDITRYNQVAASLGDDVCVLPYGHVLGQGVDDHLHIDLGYLTVVPRTIGEKGA